MTASSGTLPSSIAVSSSLKKKRVLLVDASSSKRDLRAEAMRKLGLEVDCAVDILEARSWWRADLYDLVLLNVANELGHRDKFCDDIRGATPPQQFAFLVGKPEYLGDLPNPDAPPSPPLNSESALFADLTPVPSSSSGGPEQRWGILEASRRISEVRSLWVARSKAIRERPAPARDSEMRPSRRTAAWSQVLPELQKEEIQ